MPNLGTVVLSGKSGQDYEFVVYGRDTDFKACGAVYVVAMRFATPAQGIGYRHIYVGHTGNLSDSPLTHCRTGCFEQVGAHWMLLRLEGNEDRRAAIADDLREHLDPPCNNDPHGNCRYPTPDCPRVWPYGR